MALARVLVVLGVLFAVASVIAGYVRYQALDTPTVEKTANDLIADDEIRNQVAATLVDQLFSNVDVQASLEQRLPKDQQALAAPLAAAMRELADRAARRLLAGPKFQALWADSIVRAHEQLVRLLNDELTECQHGKRGRGAESSTACHPARRSGRSFRCACETPTRRHGPRRGPSVRPARDRAESDAAPEQPRTVPLARAAGAFRNRPVARARPAAHDAADDRDRPHTWPACSSCSSVGSQVTIRRSRRQERRRTAGCQRRVGHPDRRSLRMAAGRSSCSE